MMTVASIVIGLFAAAWVAFKPLAFRLLPQDFVGPDGWYYDTRQGKGIFDWRRRA